MIVIGIVVGVCAASLGSALWLGKKLEEASYHYAPLTNATRHVPGRDDREIVENLLRPDVEQIELGI
jgi:hypothetical protein